MRNGSARGYRNAIVASSEPLARPLPDTVAKTYSRHGRQTADGTAP